jgi:hypothetical protein
VGAEDLPGVIVTRTLHVEQSWHPQPQKARVGDAFTRTVTVMAPDVPGMLFPPLPFAEVEGLAVYAKPPVVEDRVERGELTGKRTQAVTYLCERPGQFTLPALVIPWWDLENQQLGRTRLPAVTLEVGPAPVQDTDTTSPPVGRSWRQRLWWVFGAAALLVAAMTTLRYTRRARRAVWQRQHTQGQASEPRLFGQLLDACRARDTRTTYNALLRWLDVRQCGPDAATIEAFLASHPDASLRRQVEMLQDAVLGQQTAWDGAALADGLRQARRHDRQRGRRAAQPRLPDLNPG